MSQAGIINTASGPVPPTVAITFHTPSGDATPIANTIQFLADQTASNFDKGITDTGSSNIVTYFVTNRATGTSSTSDATVTNIITLPMGATPGTFYVYGNVQAFNSTTPASAAYSFSGGYRTDGVTATELGTEFHDTFQDPALTTSDIFLTPSGNNINVQVKGLALPINWNALLEYRKVS